MLDIKVAAPKSSSNGVSQCMLCPPDDDSVAAAPVVKQCMLCPPDDDAIVGDSRLLPWPSRVHCAPSSATVALPTLPLLMTVPWISSMSMILAL
jgi:hypothetical protein